MVRGGVYITAAPDVVERLRRLCVTGDGEPRLFGLPVYEATVLLRGWWMRWEDGLPRDAGKFECVAVTGRST